MNSVTNFNVSITDDDIAAISALSNHARADLAAHINSTNPQLLFDFVVGKDGKQIICPFCGSGSGKHHTGAIISFENGVWLYHCFACDNFKGDLLKIIATANHLSTNGKDFFKVLAIASKILGISISAFADSTSATKKDSHYNESTLKIKQPSADLKLLADSQNNLPDFIEKLGGSWRGLSLETLQRIHCGFLPDVYFPAAHQALPAVIIPNDLNGFYCRSVTGKFHRNNNPMATTTVYLPNSDSFDLVITEGQINALSILQAFHEPNFGIMACSGTSGEKLILDKLQSLSNAGKTFRIILAFDNDANLAGKIASDKILLSLNNAGYFACSIDVTHIPDFDLNDLLQRDGEIVLRESFSLSLKLAQEELNKITRHNESALFGENISTYITEHFQTYVDDNKKYSHRKTGFDNLDAEIKTFRPGIYVLGGLPALGKTTFALQLLEQLAKNGDHCFFCSFEMEKGFLLSKLLAREVYRIESHNFDSPIKNPLTAIKISQGNIYEHGNAYRTVIKNFFEQPIPLFIWELDDLNIDSLLERLQNICAKLEKPPIVCIDYLQLLAAGNENTKSALDDILHKIFSFRRNTNSTFIVISSLNRANYHTEISFESFKETGSIEYSADVIWGLQLLLDKRTHADAEKAKKEIPRKIQLKCLKNRFGSNFDVGFFYYPNADVFLPMPEYGAYTDYNPNITSTGDDENDRYSSNNF